MEFMQYQKTRVIYRDESGYETKPKTPRFMLDRDQIFYSRAFRRLAGKTQLMAAGQNEVLRTRLTHTLEVSQIARSIGQALDLDLDLIEAIVFGHDLGHTPFGHVGERTLHEIMTPDTTHLLGRGCPLCTEPEKFPETLKPFLGFKHNLQSLVVAMELEKNAQGRGLNLTEYTLYGIQAHTKPAYKPGRMKNHDMLGYYRKYLEKGTKIDGRDAWSLEAELVAQADEIAQWHHDLEDALLAGMISPKEIVKTMEPMLRHRKAALPQDEKQLLEHPERYDPDHFAYLYTRIVVEMLMAKLTEHASAKIKELGGTQAVAIQAHNAGNNGKMAHIVPESGDQETITVKDIFSYGDKTELGSFARAVEDFPDRIGSFLKAKSIKDADDAGRGCIRDLFRGYYTNPKSLPEECVYAFFGAYHALKDDASVRELCLPEFQIRSEAQLRAEGACAGTAGIRKQFDTLFEDWAKTTKVEELLLMRTICNHIASMTDADARRAVEQFRK